jgi:hypothetical protein
LGKLKFLNYPEAVQLKSGGMNYLTLKWKQFNISLNQSDVKNFLNYDSVLKKVNVSIQKGLHLKQMLELKLQKLGSVCQQQPVLRKNLQ